MRSNGKHLFSCILLLFFYSFCNAQEKEVLPPYNIKTATFVQNNQNAIPVFSLSDSFGFQFDDLYGDEANYYYQIVHCDYDWKPSQLSKSEYLTGFDDQRIQDYKICLENLVMRAYHSSKIEEIVFVVLPVNEIPFWSLPEITFDVIIVLFTFTISIP